VRLGGIVRLCLRLPLLVCWTLAMFALRMAILPTRWVNPPSELRMRAFLFRLWGRGAIWLMGGKLVVLGNPPQPPFLLVTNHLSYVDIITSAALLGTTFVAKAEIAHWPLIGFFAKNLQTVFINRNDLRDVVRVKNEVGNILRKGYGLHIFAEGGISQDLQVKPFKPALLDAAVRNHLPVHYAAITYATGQYDPPPSQVVAWLEGKSFARHLLELLMAPGFTVKFTFGDQPIQANCRKELAQRLTEAVRALYVPIP